MSVEILDIVFRLERKFGVKIRRELLKTIFGKNEPPDIMIGEMFDFVRRRAVLAGVLDDEMDAESIWLIFQHEVADALGIEPDEVTKDQWLIQGLGAG